MKHKFEDLEWRKYDGQKIDNIGDYVLNYVKNVDKEAKVMVGCDSKVTGRKTSYAITIVFYNEKMRKGAHVVHSRVLFPRIKDVISKLWNEAVFVHDVAEEIDNILRKTKYNYIFEKNYYDGSIPKKLVEIHVDLNASKSTRNGRRYSNNKSNKIYSDVMGWLCGERYKVMAKPYAYGASSAGDKLCR
jgi:predicted RNase H-related nuclease YkuK (DUF458 family)